MYLSEFLLGTWIVFDKCLFFLCFFQDDENGSRGESILDLIAAALAALWDQSSGAVSEKQNNHLPQSVSFVVILNRTLIRIDSPLL